MRPSAGIILGIALFCGGSLSAIQLVSSPLYAQGIQDDELKMEAFRKDLQNILEKQLRAKTPGEFAFIRKVVKLVKKEKLPLKLVVGTFHWAREKPEHQAQYFIFGLKERAKKKGIDL